jgi:tRNA pseudouridine38-40 synthase
MALYKIILAYDGTDFSGFQRQGKSRTVQGVIETVLQELGWQQKALLFAGRTDAGVHASGQVAVFSLDWQHSSVDLINALNARLPGDVSVLEISQAEAEFHPRYDASSRRYRYRLYQLPVRHPMIERYAWRVWPELNAELLEQVAGLFIGRFDFSAFGRAMKKDGSTVREVFTSQWLKTTEGWQYEVEANAFLYHMVRRLVYVQVQYARTRLLLTDIENALLNGRLLKLGLAPAHGLSLVHVKYEDTIRGTCEDEKN